MSRLDDIVQTFQSVDPEMRVELLLDYARKLPPLPETYRQQSLLEAHRVPECQTPVSLFIEHEGGAVRIHARVAEESPTVQGFLSLLIQAFDGAAPAEVVAAPPDLLQQLGLAEVVRMTRAVGLGAVLHRIKRQAAGFLDSAKEGDN